MRKKAEKCLSLFNKKSRMYKWDIGRKKENLILSKIWNRGMGLSDTIRYEVHKYYDGRLVA